jgi:hypothetical protein
VCFHFGVSVCPCLFVSNGRGYLVERTQYCLIRLPKLGPKSRPWFARYAQLVPVTPAMGARGRCCMIGQGIAMPRAYYAELKVWANKPGKNQNRVTARVFNNSYRAGKFRRSTVKNTHERPMVSETRPVRLLSSLPARTRSVVTMNNPINLRAHRQSVFPHMFLSKINWQILSSFLGVQGKPLGLNIAS